MPETTVFGSTNPPENEKVNNKPADSSLLEVLVGEGKKYRDQEALAKAYIEADDFIETLKAENQNLRKSVEGAKTIESVLERLDAQAAPKGDTPKGISAPELAKIVRETVTGLESEKTRKENLLKADAGMKALYGDKAQEVFDREANNPATKVALMALAEADPDKFVALFDKRAATQSGTVASSGGHNVAAMQGSSAPNTNDTSTEAYYSNIRRTNPKLYYTAEFQLKMHKAAQANPEKFFKR